MGYVNKTYLSTQFKNFADKIAKVFSKIGHTHLKSDITDFPTSMPANGGNAATVGGHTVGVNVPSNAKFTDTTYSKLSEFTDDVGYVKNTDARLTDARNAKDVYAWAKASTKPTYTASEVGLGNVGNFKAVSTVANQGLSSTEKANARANIGAGTSSFSGSYNDLTNKPTIPSVGNGTVTIKQAGTSKGTFTMNQNGNTTIELTDNNTWRGIQNNLTSDSTTDSLSAAQGKVLKGLVDGKAASSHTHTKSQITDFPTSLPANGGTSSYTNMINGTYTGNGGAQPPSYITSGKVRFNMMNAFEGLSNLPTYADCILMDTYGGSDVPYVTGLGIVKASGNPRAFIAVGAKGNTTTWASQTELITKANIGSQSVSNADTVDGFHASDFITASNTNLQVISVSNSDTAISLKSNSSSSWIGFMNSSGVSLGYFGVNSSNEACFYTSNNGTKKIITTGNIGSQSVNYANTAGSAPASDVYAWAKASSKPSYSWSEITSKPSTFTPASHTHTTATTSLNGFMSSSDKSKLDGIEEGATARTGALTINMREKNSTLVLTFTGKVDKTISFNNWETGTTLGTVCAGNDSRLSDARPASDVYAWAKASTPDGIFDGGTYKGNIDSYTESTLRPGKTYYISTTNISSNSALPFSGYGILTSYAAGSAIVQQIFRYNGSSKIIDAIYTRMYINNGWTSWSKVTLTKV